MLRGSTPVHRDAFAHAYRTVYGRELSLDGISAAGRTDLWLLFEPLRRAGVSPDIIRAGVPEAFRVMTAYVEKHVPDLHDRLLPGVPGVPAGLHAEGQQLGLLTGNLRGIALAKMRAAGLDVYFQTGGFGSESEERSHLVPVALRHASQQAGRTISAEEVVIIGDTPLDIAAGAACGTQTVGVATGPFSEEDLRRAGAHLVLPSLAPAPQTVQVLLALTRPKRS